MSLSEARKPVICLPKEAYVQRDSPEVVRAKTNDTSTIGRLAYSGGKIAQDLGKLIIGNIIC